MWRQAFSKANKYEDSGFEIQVERFLSGKDLHSNGKNPDGPKTTGGGTEEKASLFDTTDVADAVW